MSSLAELQAIDAELEALEFQLERARQKKEAVAIVAEKSRNYDDNAQSSSTVATPDKRSSINDSMDLQLQIEQLQRELEAQNLDLAVSKGAGQAAIGDTTYDAPMTRPVRRSTIKKKCPDPTQAPVRPSRRESRILPLEGSESNGEMDFGVIHEEQEAGQQHHQPQQQQQKYEPVKGASETAKQTHQWEKPAWAIPSEALPEDSIQKDSIQNPLLKQAKAGYERKVRPADLELIQGKFVQASVKKPDPRLVWIVVNIDGCKVGKIVMHLYGNHLPLCDVFVELKGLELKRGAAANTYFIDDIDPHFYVHQGSAASFRGPKNACYGIVQEGQDICQKLSAADTDSIFTIKQSHIYPVKKAK